MSRYLLTDEAKEDLVEIRRYLRREAGAQVALSVARRFSEAFALLSGQPGIGHVREDLTSENVKFWSVFSYLIVYNPASKPLEIIRVLHGARDVASLLEGGSQPEAS